MNNSWIKVFVCVYCWPSYHRLLFSKSWYQVLHQHLNLLVSACVLLNWFDVLHSFSLSDKPQKSCQKTKVSFKYVLLSVFLSSCYLPIAHTPNITTMGFLHFSSGHNTSL